MVSGSKNREIARHTGEDADFTAYRQTPTMRFESPWRYSSKALLMRGFRRFRVARVAGGTISVY